MAMYKRIGLARVVVAVAAVLALSVAATAYASSSHESKGPHKTSSGIVGAWSVHLVFVKNGPPGFPGEMLAQGFNRDGVTSFFADGNGESGYGAWKWTGKHAFKFTIREPKVGGGYVIIKQTGTVAKDGKTFSTSGTATLYNAADVQQGLSADITLDGTRIEA